MEQRRLRLGDILDDYCPRERRVTNHAVVAMIEEDVKQTRCTTCDAEHAYKGARVPKRRKKETPAALYKEVLAGMPDVEDAPRARGRASRSRGGRGTPQRARRRARRAGRRRYPACRHRRSLPSPARFHRSDGSLPSSSALGDAVASADDGRCAGRGPRRRRAGAPAADSRNASASRRSEGCPSGPDFTARHIPARGTGHGGFRGDRDACACAAAAAAQRQWQRPRQCLRTCNGNARQGGPASRATGPPVRGVQSMGGRAGGGGFRNGNGSGNGNKRGRGSRG